MEIKSGNQQKSKDENIKQDIFIEGKDWLFKRCYQLSSNFEIHFLLASILVIFEEMQLFAIVSRLSQNPTIAKSSQTRYIDAVSKIIILDFDHTSNLFLSLLLLFMQLLTSLAIFLPIENKSINKFLSKFLVYLLQMTIAIPSILLSTSGIIKSHNISLNVILYLLSIINNLIFWGLIYDSSFKRQNINVLVRGLRPLSSRNVVMILVTMFPILQYVSSSFFIFYIISMLVICLYKWHDLTKNFLFFNQWLTTLQGFMISFNISAYLCYVTLYILDNAIISENVSLFISVFSVFLANFFRIYRNNIVRNIIIYKQLKGQDEIAIYCLFYWHCFKNITEKKNELYLSSLLKKHISQCSKDSCCCKNRQNLYNAESKSFGDPSLQPHFDVIFIKHFILKLFEDGYQKFPKSKLLIILICTYIIEIIEVPPRIMELIKKLVKMQAKNQLSLDQQFTLYSLKHKLREKIQEINANRGNLNLQAVKQFDKNLVVLMQDLKSSVKIHYKLWNVLYMSRLNEAKLYLCCKEGLSMMFKMELNYQSLKKLNSQSTQLRSIMLFYAKVILHDVHLLSQIRKEIKNNIENHLILSTSQNKLLKLNLFGSKTVSLISYQNSKIKWSSQHAHKIFEYSPEDFQSLTIKNLMPRYFADNHDKYIENWKSTGYSTKLNNTSYLWGNTKSGNCFSMLMYVKMIALHHEQEYAFFSIIQKLDDQHEIICSLTGQIYGVGKLFTESLFINPKIIQQTTPHIQIFIPSAFQYFLQSFYDIPKNNQAFKFKRNNETRKQGFFPQEIEQILKFTKRQKKNLSLNPTQDNKKQLLNFVRLKMQEITSNIAGQYISFIVSCVRLSAHKNKKYMVLKISNPKRNNVELYYIQLQAAIHKLQNLSDQYYQKHKMAKNKNNNNKFDFFNVFLNPKKMIKAIQNQQQNKSQKSIFFNNQQPSFNEFTMKSKKNTQKIVNHRKLLAVSAQNEIKSQKVRYYLWKIKNALLEQGIISRYTYNLLIGKSNYGGSAAELSLGTLSDQRQLTFDKKKSIRYDDQQNNYSEEDRQSFDGDSQEQLNNIKESAHQTFNSGSSSATFISMTNHVKVFKEKLKSLNTPSYLYFLNILKITTAIGGILGIGVLMYNNFPGLDSALQQFNVNKQASLIMDTLLLGQLNIINLKNNNNTFYQFQKSYYDKKTGAVYQDHMAKYAEYQKKDAYKLSYLSFDVTGEIKFKMFGFIHKIYTQILTDNFSIEQKMFKQAIGKIKNRSNNNKIYLKVPNNLFKYFLIYLCIALAIAFISFPILYKLQLKVFEMYNLLRKISVKEKNKFHDHYTLIHEQFKLIGDVEDINSIWYKYQNKSRNFTTLNAEKQQKTQVQSKKQKQQVFKVDKAIFIKVIVIYAILIGVIFFKYQYSVYYYNQFFGDSTTFSQVFNEKTSMTHRIVSLQLELMGNKHQATTYSDEVKIVQAIYDTFHLPLISNSYVNLIKTFTTGQCCDLIVNDLGERQYQLCQKVNNKTFSQGCFDNLYLTQRKLEERLKQYYIARNMTNNSGQSIIYPEYFKSDEYKGINAGYFFNTLMVFKIYDQLTEEMYRFNWNFKKQLVISNIVTATSFIIFILVWVYIYFKLAENSTYINAFLLLIPYEILSENPYIKLYIRKEFDFKTGGD